jgi:hypothetical protein
MSSRIFTCCPTSSASAVSPKRKSLNLDAIITLLICLLCDLILQISHVIHLCSSAHAGVIMDSTRPASDDSRSSSSSNGLPKRPIDPITRTALRYTISPREYELLHQYLISRAPERVQNRTPNPTRYEKITKSASDTSDYNVATLRTALRLFAGAFTGLKTWELVSSQIARRRGGTS